MGNSPPTGGLRLPNTDCSYVVSVGQSVTIQFAGRNLQKHNKGESTEESWAMAYNSGKRKCWFSLSKTSRNTTTTSPYNDNDEKLEIVIQDDYCLGPESSNRFSLAITLEKDEPAALPFVSDSCQWWVQIHGRCRTRFVSGINTPNAHGEITSTEIRIYENDGTTQGLIVREFKRRTEDGRLRMMTVAHYCLDERVGIGLSMTVKRIRLLSNGNFDFVVDGPEQHPVDALAYMFKEVVRTKSWKPTDCPHCAKRYIYERQSESDQSDIEIVPAPRHQQQNGRTILSNLGWFKGKDIGNTYIKNLYGRKI